MVPREKKIVCRPLRSHLISVMQNLKVGSHVFLAGYVTKGSKFCENQMMVSKVSAINEESLLNTEVDFISLILWCLAAPKGAISL